MKNKLLFTFALITIALLHDYILNSIKVKENMVAVKPQKKVSPIINLQRVAIKKPEPIVEPVVEEVPEPPQPVVKEIIVPPKKIKKKAIKKVVKKKINKKIVKKVVKKKKKKVAKKQKTKKQKIAKKPSRMQRSAPKSKAIKNAYLAKVRRTIERRKKYPKAAKRMRQQGTAYIKFTISSNGSIKHVKLSKSCPYAKLNKAALNILKKIGSFGPIPKELGKKYLTLTVPIKYKITN